MQPFFQPLFLNKKSKCPKKAREALWLWTLSVSVRGLRVFSPASGCRVTSPPPALWVSSLNTPNLQAECTSLKLVCSKSWRFSVIKQNVLNINQLTSVFCSSNIQVSSFCLVWKMWACVGGWERVCTCWCAFDLTKQMLCSNEMAEGLSWISWVAAYQDGALLLSLCSVCGLSSWKHQALWVRRFTSMHTQDFMHSNLSADPFRVDVGREFSRERLCVSVCTQWHPFIFVLLFECDCCVLRAVLMHGPN